MKQSSWLSVPASKKLGAVLECGGKPTGRDAALALHATSGHKAPSLLRWANHMRMRFESAVAAPALPAHSKDIALECGGKPAGRDAALALHATSGHKAPSLFHWANYMRMRFESAVAAPALPAHSKDIALECGGKPAGRDAAFVNPYKIARND